MTIKTALMSIQRRGVDFGKAKRTWGLFSEMGTGKTLTAIAWAVESRLTKVAILGRRDDLATWETELQTHAPTEQVHNICLKKSKAKRLAALAAWQATRARFCLMTYDSIKQLLPALLKIPYDGVIADECTEIKHHNTQRTRAILKVFGRTPHRLAMTGTPVTNSPEDLFSQMLFIDGGQRLGTNFWAFRTRYFWPEPSGHKWHIFPAALEKLRTLIYQTSIRFTKAEALPDLPPKQYLRKECPLTPEQAKHYNQIKKDYELTLQSGEIWEFDYAIQQFIKLLQITGGFYYGPAPSRHSISLPSGKLDTLKWMLSLEEFRQPKQKLVIWAAFNHELERIRDVAAALGYHGVVFWKHTLDRKAARQQFQNDPKCQLFIGQIASGIGMNELKVADTTIYFSRSLKLAHRLQSEDRTHRKGSEMHERIRYIDLITPNTVDQKVYTMLRKCKDIADQIIDGRSAMEFLK